MMAASSLQMTRREDGSYLFDFVNHSQQVLFTLNECRQFSNLCDCSVVVEGQVFYAHKGVLVSCSDYFKEIFTSQTVNARQSIDLVNVKVPGFQLFIDFAYMARMAMTMQEVDMVLNTAVALKSGTMLEACCEFLKSQLTGDNCVDILSIAEAYNLTEIKRQANRLMCERLIELSQTYKKGMPDTKEDLEALTARFAAQTSQAAQLPILSAVSAVSAQLPAALMQHQSSSQQQQNLVAAQAQAILEEATSKLEEAAAKLNVTNAAAKMEEQSAASSGTDDEDDPGGMETDSSEDDLCAEEKPLLVAQLPMASSNKPVLRRLQNRTNRSGLQHTGEQRLKIATKAALKSPIVTRSHGRQTVRPKRNLRFQRALRIKKGAIAHTKIKKDYFCKICELTFAKLRDLRTHTSEQHHKCTKCSKYFMHPHELDSHLIVHTNRDLQQKGPKRYQCHFCGKHCGYSSALKIHIRTHTGEKPYQCDLCDQRFIQSINLKRHVLTNHSKETPYQCKFCGKKFSVYVYLKSHEITHSDHRPFQCEACGAMFKRKSDLRSHNRVHSTEKPYSCELCHAKFKSPNDLKTHTLIHNDRKPHTCDKCGACFKRTGHLNRHMMIHTNAKPFQCETCGAQFNRKENLRSHQRIHSGEQPYKCGVCGASFRHLSSLKMHEKNHWSDRPAEQETSIPTVHDPTPTLQHIAALMGLGGLGGNPQQTGLSVTSMSAHPAGGTVSTPQLNVSTPAQLMTQVMSSQQLQRDMIQLPVQVKIYPSVADQMPPSSSPHTIDSQAMRNHTNSPPPQQQSHMTSALMGLQGLANHASIPVAVTLSAADTHSSHMNSPPPGHMASGLMGLQALTGQHHTSIPVSVTLTDAANTPPPQISASVMTPHEQISHRDQIPLHPLQVKVYPNPDANTVPTSTQAMTMGSLSQRAQMTSPSPGAHMASGLVQHGIHLGMPQNLQVHVQSGQGITTTQAALQDHTVYMSM